MTENHTKGTENITSHKRQEKPKPPIYVMVRGAPGRATGAQGKGCAPCSLSPLL